MDADSFVVVTILTLNCGILTEGIAQTVAS